MADREDILRAIAQAEAELLRLPPSARRAAEDRLDHLTLQLLPPHLRPVKARRRRF